MFKGTNYQKWVQVDWNNSDFHLHEKGTPLCKEKKHIYMYFKWGPENYSYRFSLVWCLRRMQGCELGTQLLWALIVGAEACKFTTTKVKIPLFKSINFPGAQSWNTGVLSSNVTYYPGDMLTNHSSCLNFIFLVCKMEKWMPALHSFQSCNEGWI